MPVHAIDTDSFTFCASHWPTGDINIVATPNVHQSFVSLHDLRDSTNSQLLGVLRPDGKPGMTMAIRLCSRDALLHAFAVYEDGCLRMWDLRSMREPLATSSAPVSSATVSNPPDVVPDEDELPIPDELQSARKIDQQSSLQVYSKTEPATCLDVDAAVHGRAFIGGSTASMQFVDIDFAQGRLTTAATVELRKPGLGAICVRRDARLVASGGWDSKVRIFTAKRMRPLMIVREHVGSVFALDFGFAPVHLLASGGKDGHVVVHNVYSNETT